MSGLAQLQRWPAAVEQKSSSASAHLGARIRYLRDSRVVIVVLVKGPSSFLARSGVFRVSSAQPSDSELRRSEHLRPYSASSSDRFL